jgi:hypothetical protein
MVKEKKKFNCPVILNTCKFSFIEMCISPKQRCWLVMDENPGDE